MNTEHLDSMTTSQIAGELLSGRCVSPIYRVDMLDSGGTEPGSMRVHCAAQNNDNLQFRNGSFLEFSALILFLFMTVTNYETENYSWQRVTVFFIEHQEGKRLFSQGCPFCDRNLLADLTT